MEFEQAWAMELLTHKARALLFALKAHEGQKRKFSDKPFVVHPIAVADVVSTVIGDEEVIAAGYLHDVIEKTPVPREMLLGEFGERVFRFVEELTDPFTEEAYGELSREERTRRECERLAGISFEAKLIKLADILCNLWEYTRSTEAVPRDSIEKKAAMLEVVSDAHPTLSDSARRLLVELRRS